ncbi:MAG: hypothetical protein ACP5E4_03420 [Candidatus Aenigmatarchaeota archaeon]
MGADFWEDSGPNYSLLSPYVGARKEDNFLTTGISWNGNKETWVYPEERFILSQLKIPLSDIEELILGGIHLGDCVERLANYAYLQGMLIKVDEDTTELFFPRTSLGGEIPLELEALYFSFLEYPTLIKEAIEYRTSKPWLTWRLPGN